MNSDFSIALHCLLLLADQPDIIATSNVIAERACVHPVRIRKILGTLKKKDIFNQKKEQVVAFF